jgi:hypothetical protein
MKEFLGFLGIALGAYVSRVVALPAARQRWDRSGGRA